MRILFFLSIILLLSSCKSSNLDLLKQSLMPTKAETLSALDQSYHDNDMIKYNYAYALAESKEYDKALDIIDSAENSKTLRFYTLKIYIYKCLENYEMYEKTLIELTLLDRAFILAQVELMNYYNDNDMLDEAIKRAKIILVYDRENQAAIKVLAKRIKFYESLIKE